MTVGIQTIFHHLHTFSSHSPPKHSLTYSCMLSLRQDRIESLLTSDCHWLALLADHILFLQLFKYLNITLKNGFDIMPVTDCWTDNRKQITSNSSQVTILLVHFHILSEILRQVNYHNPLTT